MTTVLVSQSSTLTLLTLQILVTLAGDFTSNNPVTFHLSHLKQKMASADRDEILLSPPPLNANHRSDESGGFYKSEKPPQISPPGNHPPTTPNPPGDHSKSDSSSQHRFLSPSEWARVAHGIGAIKDGETHTVVHPTCWYWPSKGLPDGLYRDVVTQRTKYYISYQLLSTLRWFLMIVQITIGAVLTALGSIKLYDTSTPITALAAANTIGAGILALLHNSGLPDRYRLDKAEFSKVEDFLKVRLYSIIPAPNI